ncbi:MAG: hypothetical protein A2181_07390 [Bdellovibrionales bacterium RIFOXYA1_FULL_38_20]|nr:MAG: hypothetical protein A2181_07390 [Bdellovibrionales bacterium RIFOXYA1_FULL_38_20]
MVYLAINNLSLYTARGSNEVPVTNIFWNKFVEKQLDRVPELIVRKFRIWVNLVEENGVREVRRCIEKFMVDMLS